MDAERDRATEENERLVLCISLFSLLLLLRAVAVCDWPHTGCAVLSRIGAAVVREREREIGTAVVKCGHQCENVSNEMEGSPRGLSTRRLIGSLIEKCRL